VNIAGESDLSPGTLVDVRIERGFPNSLLGRRQEKIEEKISSKAIRVNASKARQQFVSAS